MNVLTDMRARSTEDILITATDNVNGFTHTIKNVFPESKIQIYIVHQIRNACRYVEWKDKQAFTSGYKTHLQCTYTSRRRGHLKDFTYK
nr:transposase [Tamlana agarivorans]